jgi:2'-5' RNA ligase
MNYESILMIPVPAAEPVVEQCRSKYDPSAADGMPAHITINYPFVHDESNPERTVDKLEKLFAGFEAFNYSIASFDMFPNVLFLKPVPVAPFVRMIESVAQLFPDSPPYGGKYDEINPHMTIAQMDDKQRLESVKNEFLSHCGEKLPIEAKADQIWLMDNRPGSWKKLAVFKLQ